MQVKFTHHHETVSIEAGQTILDAARLADVNITAQCGGNRKCARCTIRLISGEAIVTEEEKRLLGDKKLASGIRLACCAVPLSDVVVDAEVSKNKAAILTTSIINDYKLNPLLTKRHSAQDDTTTVSDGRGPFAKEAGDTTALLYGICIDIGTTTVAVKLVDVNTGETIDVCSEMNRQKAFGADVLNRIGFSWESEKNMRLVSSTIRKQIDSMIGEMLGERNITPSNVYAVVIAGNTAMLQLLAQIDCSRLGKMPFEAELSGEVVFSPQELELTNTHEKAEVFLMPIIGSFVGGDTTSCVVASQMHKAEGVTVLVDIGTNGEIVLNTGKQMIASSTAAGPALEGVRIASGMQAAPGAIDRCRFTGTDIATGTIGHQPAKGTCGSGLIDAIAAMIDAGVLNKLGGFTDKPEELPEAIQKRIVKDGNNPRFILDFDSDIAITQRDVRELQLACGAIKAGVTILLKRFGLTAADVRQLLLAGGFGSFINKASACKAGLLPVLPEEKIISIGNAALAGAKRVLLDKAARREAIDLSGAIEHFELATNLDFQTEFAEAMIYP
jgi:uncharacterized 2Fe-2S/4Fe-4S cluster protein (DUF4445 family)